MEKFVSVVKRTFAILLVFFMLSLQAMAELDVSEKMPELKEKLTELLALEVEPENKKHVDEEIRALRKIIIQAEGIRRHTPDLKGKHVKVILLTNRTQRETIGGTGRDR